MFGPAFYAIDGPVQVSIDRVLWVGLFVVLAIRWRMGQLSLSKPARVDWVVVGLTVWLLLSTFRGDPPAGSSPAARWLFYIAMPAGMYAVGRCVMIRPGDVRRLMVVLMGLGGYLAVTAVCEVQGQHWLVYPSHIVDGHTIYPRAIESNSNI